MVGPFDDVDDDMDMQSDLTRSGQVIIKAVKEVSTISPSSLRDEFDSEIEESYVGEALIEMFAPHTEGDWVSGDIFNPNKEELLNELACKMHETGLKFIKNHPEILSQTQYIQNTKFLEVIKNEKGVWVQATEKDRKRSDENLASTAAKYMALRKLTPEERKLLGL